MNQILFEEKINAALNEIGAKKLSYDRSEEWTYKEVYEELWRYAHSNQLYHLALALPLVRALVDGQYRGSIILEDGQTHPLPHFHHCCIVCRLLLNLHPVPAGSDEEDILLASALCHDLIGHVFYQNPREALRTYHLDPQIYEIISFINCYELKTEDALRDFYQRFYSPDRCFEILIELADYCCIIEKLYTEPIWKVREYIYLIRTYHLPLGVYAKEAFPELYAPIGVMIEKMRSLSDATDILVSRYEHRSLELHNELFALKEENARYRRLISEFK